jgi:anti-sigma B factor antagonist
VGKGSFLTSPAMKAFGEERIAAGERCLVVDLGSCTGMDSTFMGTLAGMAARLSVIDGGTLQIADTGDRNRRSLEDLGLDFLLEIDPPDAFWREMMDEIRDALRPPRSAVGANPCQQARHVLEAHEVLSQANEGNARKFATVVSLLKAELAEGPEQER